MSDPSNHATAITEHAPQGSAYLDIVMERRDDGRPGEFIEVETAEGFSVRIGEWVVRADGYMVLRIRRHDMATHLRVEPEGRRTEKAPTCPCCQNERWICEQHPSKPWPHDDCAVGTPCPTCNVSEPPEMAEGYVSAIRANEWS